MSDLSAALSESDRPADDASADEASGRDASGDAWDDVEWGNPFDTSG